MEAEKLKNVAYADVKLPATDEAAKKTRLAEIESVFGTRSTPKIKKYLEDNNIEQHQGRRLRHRRHHARQIYQPR